MERIIFGDDRDVLPAYEDCKVILLPVPYDGTSTYVKGADKGPQAIIDAFPNQEFFDLEVKKDISQIGICVGDIVRERKTPESMTTAVEKSVSELIKKKKFIVLIGGEHSVSVGSVQAHAKQFRNLSVLQLDAHADLRESYHGSKYNHACAMARIKESCPIVQVGIRSAPESEVRDMKKGNVFFAADIMENDSWMDSCVKKLSENVYITIDLDAFDPSIMPSTGTPEPGGMQWYQSLKLLKKVFDSKNVVGLDVVELCPNPADKGPDFLAAKLIYKLLSYKFKDS